MTPYEDTAFAPEDMLDGYPSMPSYGYTQPVTPVAETPMPDFDPRKDIDPLAGKVFRSIGEARHIKPMEKLAMQSEFLAGVQDVQMQRMKLEDERRRSMMDSLRLQQAQDSIIANRQRQQAAADRTVRRTEFSNALKSVLDSKDDPLTKLGNIDKIAAQDLALVASDPAVSDVYRTARSMVPLPKMSRLTETQIMENMEKGVPADIIATGDPYIIGGFRRLAELDERKRTADEAAQQEARKERATLLRDLAKDDFRFLTKEEREEMNVDYVTTDESGARKQVVNPNQYLNPADHERGRLLARITLGADGYAEFEKLSDEQKRDTLRELRVKALTDALDEVTAPPVPKAAAKVDRLFGVK